MRLKLIAVAALLWLGAGALILFKPASGPEETVPAQEKAPQVKPAEPVATAAVKPVPVTPPTPLSVKESETSKKAWKEFKYTPELERFIALGEKVLPKDAEKEEKARLLHDSRFIQSLEPVLLSVATDETQTRLQNAAMDVLFDAFQNGARDEALKVMQNVVADPGVEDSQRDLSARKALAGVKAEVLFFWAAMDPRAADNINATLPGPVSQKIWVNVRQQQEKNLAESATLQTRR